MHDGGEFLSYQGGKNSGFPVVTGDALQNLQNYSAWQRGRREAENAASPRPTVAAQEAADISH